MGSKNTMYYSQELDRWVSPGEENEIRKEAQDRQMPPPKIAGAAPPLSQANSMLSHDLRSRYPVPSYAQNYFTNRRTQSIDPQIADQLNLRPQVTKSVPPTPHNIYQQNTTVPQPDSTSKSYLGQSKPTQASGFESSDRPYRRESQPLGHEIRSQYQPDHFQYQPDHSQYNPDHSQYLPDGGSLSADKTLEPETILGRIDDTTTSRRMMNSRQIKLDRDHSGNIPRLHMDYGIADMPAGYGLHPSGETYSKQTAKGPLVKMPCPKPVDQWSTETHQPKLSASMVAASPEMGFSQTPAFGSTTKAVAQSRVRKGGPPPFLEHHGPPSLEQLPNPWEQPKSVIGNVYNSPRGEYENDAQLSIGVNHLEALGEKSSQNEEYRGALGQRPLRGSNKLDSISDKLHYVSEGDQISPNCGDQSTSFMQATMDLANSMSHRKSETPLVSEAVVARCQPYSEDSSRRLVGASSMTGGRPPLIPKVPKKPDGDANPIFPHQQLNTRYSRRQNSIQSTDMYTAKRKLSSVINFSGNRIRSIGTPPDSPVSAAATRTDHAESRLADWFLYKNKFCGVQSESETQSPGCYTDKDSPEATRYPIISATDLAPTTNATESGYTEAISSLIQMCVKDVGGFRESDRKTILIQFESMTRKMTTVPRDWNLFISALRGGLSKPPGRLRPVEIFRTKLDEYIDTTAGSINSLNRLCRNAAELMATESDDENIDYRSDCLLEDIKNQISIATSSLGTMRAQLAHARRSAEESQFEATKNFEKAANLERQLEKLSISMTETLEFERRKHEEALRQIELNTSQDRVSYISEANINLQHEKNLRLSVEDDFRSARAEWVNEMSKVRNSDEFSRMTSLINTLEEKSQKQILDAQQEAERNAQREAQRKAEREAQQEGQRETQREVEKLRIEIAERDKTIFELETQLNDSASELRARDDDLASTREEVEMLEAALCGANDDVMDAKHSLDQMSREVEILRNTVEAGEREMEILRTSVGAGERDFGNITASLGKAENRVKEVEKQLEDNKHWLEERRRSFESILEQKNDEILQIRNELHRFQKERGHEVRITPSDELAELRQKYEQKESNLVEMKLDLAAKIHQQEENTRRILDLEKYLMTQERNVTEAIQSREEASSTLANIFEVLDEVESHCRVLKLENLKLKRVKERLEAEVEFCASGILKPELFEVQKLVSRARDVFCETTAE